MKDIQMANESIVPYSLDDYFKSTPIGSLDKAIGNNLFGINHRQIQTAVPSNKDSYGLTFFVRPQLNLLSENIRNVRQFSPLLTNQQLSVQRYVRCMLDPRQQAGYMFGSGSARNMIPRVMNQLVDNNNCFIPILTNNLNSISGWPDVVAPTFTSKPGLYNEAISQVDGITRNYETFDIDASFRNTRGDPILYMFYIWLHYSSFVYEGKLVPYLDFITENEYDYNTRIYRLVLDKNKDKVTKIAACGAAFPISIPTGSFFDYSSEKPYNDQNKDISIRFKCMGVDYQDDITIREFNQCVVNFNDSMSDDNRSTQMTLIPKTLLTIFNNRGYPRIDTNSYTLEWYVDNDLYASKVSSFLNANIDPSVDPDTFGD